MSEITMFNLQKKKFVNKNRRFLKLITTLAIKAN